MTDKIHQAEDAKRLGTNQSLDQPSDAQINHEISRLNSMIQQNDKAMQKAITEANAIAERLSKEAQDPSARHQTQYKNTPPSAPKGKRGAAGGSTTDKFQSGPLSRVTECGTFRPSPVKDWYNVPEERPHDRYENEDESANALFGHKKEYVERLKKRETDDDGPYDT
ncbi:hypothetical protein Daus18300_008428 [Diaporthe australafricana]|uniref:Uncharacterized protein n=1 Tax=Diaporthe australafricana TaxID=127596 RepID=A0ABR3WI40_9PEZI